MKFIKRDPVEIEAEQWDGTVDGAYLLEEKFKPYLECEINATGNKFKFVGIRVFVPDEFQNMAPTDWIIREPNGKVYILSDSDFKLMYKPAGGDI